VFLRQEPGQLFHAYNHGLGASAAKDFLRASGAGFIKHTAKLGLGLAELSGSHAENLILVDLFDQQNQNTEAGASDLIPHGKRHGLKLATLDQRLLAKPWAAGVAENPLLQAVR